MEAYLNALTWEHSSLIPYLSRDNISNSTCLSRLALISNRTRFILPYTQYHHCAEDDWFHITTSIFHEANSVLPSQQVCSSWLQSIVHAAQKAAPHIRDFRLQLLWPISSNDVCEKVSRDKVYASQIWRRLDKCSRQYIH